ncbi:gram-negative bacteria-binding protein 2-like [Drosophila obscura]|uniref:gram-negative bacteria-binding protein 2-like n=1 Tax=Drosophila obscura TaxID=7282 RepID=UPI001BB16A4B|nr:gram-negative bacteria-binding protein 2-like [Drosophila obscura]
MKSRWCVILWLTSLLVSLSAFELPDAVVKVHNSEVFLSLPGNLDGVKSTLFRAELLTDECVNNYSYTSQSSGETKMMLPKRIAENAKLRVQTLVERTNNVISSKTSVYTIDKDGMGHLDNKYPTGNSKDLDVGALVLKCKPVEKPLEPTVTETTDVKGRKFSTGDLIFEDNFNNGQKIKDTWKHEVRSRCFNGVYQEFVAFVDDPKNSYISDNKLHIKLSRAVYRNGASFQLDGCTHSSSKYKYECGPIRATQTANIPPTTSAKIHSKMSFKYGRVEIGAWLPKGDWLFPYIALQPKSKYFAENFIDQIRIYARGNALLQDRQQNTFDGRSLFGSALIWNNQKNKGHRDYWTMTTNLKNPFYNDFHNYTIIWSSDRIVFKVDGKSFGTITNAAVLSKFNEKCYIMLGLTAGGGMNFDDNVLMEQQKKRIYENTSPKVALRFKELLKKKAPERPTLVIDHVRVYAIDKNGN